MKHGTDKGECKETDWDLEVYIFEDIDDPSLFSLDRNRICLAERNGLMRLTAIQAIKNGEEHLKDSIEWFNNFVAYGKLAHKDRLNVRQSRSTIRRIVRGWDCLDEDLQQAFLEGALLPSTAVRHIKAASAK